MKGWWILILGFAVIVVGAVSLVILPGNKALAPKPTPAPTSTALTTTRGNSDLVRNVSIHPGDTVSSPLTVTGQARGTWYFEASFPIIVTDWDGKIIAQVPAHAQSDWMTQDYVPFSATLTFTTPTPGDPARNRGTLILKNDNPSGDPARDDSVEIPIIFK